MLAYLERSLTRPWFALADLGLAGLSGALWLVSPDFGAWLLPVALLPWGLRLLSRRRPFRRTAVDTVVLLFLISALVSAWAAYDPEAAWGKFWIIVGAVLLFYALAGQPHANLWLLAALLGLSGFILAVYLLLAYDWLQQPVSIVLASRVAARWMAFRPALPLPVPDADLAAGVLGLLVPFPAAVLTSRAQAKTGKIFWLGALFVMLVGLFLTAEPAPAAALGLAAAGWGWWRLSGWLAGRTRGGALRRRLNLFAGGLAGAGLIACLLLLALPDRLDPAQAGSRLELWRSSLKLAGDFPFTGGGLTAFPGLYAQYIQVIPYKFLDHSHQLFIEVAVEQGLPGMAALVVILAVSVVSLGAEQWRRSATLLGDPLFALRGAVLASLVMLILHGLVETVLYAGSDVWILFMLPGLAAALLPAPAGEVQARPLTFPRRLGLVLAGLCLAGLFLFRQPLLGKWYANLGAVAMARLELSGFPAEAWEEDTDVTALNSAVGYFRQALDANPAERTAHYRLGLVSLRARRFPEAVSELSHAYAIDPAHRGIRKSLAYALAWNGDFHQAVPLFASLPEAEKELDAYGWWWGQVGREDLGNAARQVLASLRDSGAVRDED